MSDDYIRVSQLCMAGSELQLAETDKLEKAVKVDPTDAEARVKLVAFYFRGSVGSRPLREKWFRHLFWFIENRPDHELLGLPESCPILPAKDDRALFDVGKGLWEMQLEKNPNAAKLFYHAAHYFGRNDWSTAFRLLEEAVRLEPANDKWKDRLAFAYERASSVHDDNGRLERAFSLRKELLDSSPKRDKSQRLANFVETAYRVNKFDECEAAARLIVESSSTVRCSPPDLHEAHGFIGLIQLRQNDVSGACRSLLASGMVGTYPTLATFGPSFELARALLKIGERKTVLRYLEECSTFWRSGQIYLGYWWLSIVLGGTPELNQRNAFELSLPTALNPAVRALFSLTSNGRGTPVET